MSLPSPSRLSCVALALALLSALPARGDAPPAASEAARPVRGAARDSLVVEPPAAPAEPASTPQLVQYQGRLTATDGTPRTGTVSITFALYAAATGGSPIWNENWIVTLTDGSFSVLLGSINAFPINAWSSPDRYLGITVEGEGEMTPRLRIASVPFAIETEKLGGKRATDFDAAGAAAIAAAGVSAQLKGSDADPPNVGSNQVHWNNLYGVPEGFTDGVDDVGEGTLEHSQLHGLLNNDHPQYALKSDLQTSDGNNPNVGSNQVNWNNLGAVPDPLVNQQIPGTWLAAGAVDSTRLANGGIVSRNIAAGSVNGDRLKAGTVDGSRITPGTITADQVQNNSLTGDDVQNGTLGGLDIADETIFSNDIANGSIIRADLAPGTIDSSRIEAESLTGIQVKDGSLGGEDIRSASLTGGLLVAGTVGQREIGSGAVGGDQVADGSLPAAKMIDVPGLTFLNVPGVVDSIETDVPKIVTSITVNAPAAGYVVISADTEVFLIHDTGSYSRISVGLSLTGLDLPDTTTVTVDLPGAFPSESYRLPMHTQAVYSVPFAGPFTVYLDARRGVQTRTSSLLNLKMVATYYPRLY